MQSVRIRSHGAPGRNAGVASMCITIGFEKKEMGAEPSPLAGRVGLAAARECRQSMPTGADASEAPRPVDVAETRRRCTTVPTGADPLEAARRVDLAEEKERNVPIMDQVAGALKEHRLELKKRREDVLRERSKINNMIREIDAQAFEVETILDALGGAR